MASLLDLYRSYANPQQTMQQQYADGSGGYAPSSAETVMGNSLSRGAFSEMQGWRPSGAGVPMDPNAVVNPDLGAVWSAKRTADFRDAPGPITNAYPEQGGMGAFQRRVAEDNAMMGRGGIPASDAAEELYRKYLYRGG